MRGVFITAGANGIGLAMAKRFLQANWRVWIADIDAQALENAPAECEKSMVNVADESAMQAVFSQIAQKWGNISAVMANAGVAGPTARVEDVALNEWQSCLDTTLTGAFLTAKYALKLMKPQGNGAIIFTSSTAGIYGFPNRSPYCAAKWAVIGLMKTIAMEAGPYNIRANAICPGGVMGERMERVMVKEAQIKNTTRDAIYNGYTAGTSMRLFVEANDIANCAHFLASEEARYISGQIIPVDGHTENPDPKV